MAAIDEIKEVNPEAAEDEEIKKLADDFQIAEYTAQFAKSVNGKKLIDELHRRAYGLINGVFEATHRETPTLNGIMAPIIRLEAALQMLEKFVGAQSKADVLFEVLQSRLKEKV